MNYEQLQMDEDIINTIHYCRDDQHFSEFLFEIFLYEMAAAIPASRNSTVMRFDTLGSAINIAVSMMTSYGDDPNAAPLKPRPFHDMYIASAPYATGPQYVYMYLKDEWRVSRLFMRDIEMDRTKTILSQFPTTCTLPRLTQQDHDHFQWQYAKISPEFQNRYAVIVHACRKYVWSHQGSKGDSVMINGMWGVEKYTSKYNAELIRKWSDETVEALVSPTLGSLNGDDVTETGEKSKSALKKAKKKVKKNGIPTGLENVSVVLEGTGISITTTTTPPTPIPGPSVPSMRAPSPTLPAFEIEEEKAEDEDEDWDDDEDMIMARAIIARFKQQLKYKKFVDDRAFLASAAQEYKIQHGIILRSTMNSFNNAVAKQRGAVERARQRAVAEGKKRKELEKPKKVPMEVNIKALCRHGQEINQDLARIHEAVEQARVSMEAKARNLARKEAKAKEKEAAKKKRRQERKELEAMADRSSAELEGSGSTKADPEAKTSVIGAAKGKVNATSRDKSNVNKPADRSSNNSNSDSDRAKIYSSEKEMTEKERQAEITKHLNAFLDELVRMAFSRGKLDIIQIGEQRIPYESPAVLRTFFDSEFRAILEKSRASFNSALSTITKDLVRWGVITEAEKEQLDKATKKRTQTSPLFAKFKDDSILREQMEDEYVECSGYLEHCIGENVYDIDGYSTNISPDGIDVTTAHELEEHYYDRYDYGYGFDGDDDYDYHDDDDDDYYSYDYGSPKYREGHGNYLSGHKAIMKRGPNVNGKDNCTRIGAQETGDVLDPDNDSPAGEAINDESVEQEYQQKREAAEQAAKEEAERVAREEAERVAREETERVAKEEAERVAREEAERIAKEETERIAREKAERIAKEEAERVARGEAERATREEFERVAREETKRIAKEDAERAAQKEIERIAEGEADREEAERIAREETYLIGQEPLKYSRREKAKTESELTDMEVADRIDKAMAGKVARAIEAERVAKAELDKYNSERVAKLRAANSVKATQAATLKALQEEVKAARQRESDAIQAEKAIQLKLTTDAATVEEERRLESEVQARAERFKADRVQEIAEMQRKAKDLVEQQHRNEAWRYGKEAGERYDKERQRLRLCEERSELFKADRRKEIEDMILAAKTSYEQEAAKRVKEEADRLFQETMAQPRKDLEEARLALKKAKEALSKHNKQVGAEINADRQRAEKTISAQRKYDILKTKRKNLEAERQAVVAAAGRGEPVRVPNNGAVFFYWQGIDFTLSLWRPPTDRFQGMETIIQTRYPTLLPSAESINMRHTLLLRLQNLFDLEFPGKGLILNPFGSYVTGLDSDWSDLDICIYSENFQPNATHSDVTYLADFMRRSMMMNVVAITDAKVPIVKFTDPTSGIACDMNVQHPLGIYNSDLTKAYLEIDPRLSKFLYLLKHFAKCHSILDASAGYLSSYAYILMAIVFFQDQKDASILPRLQLRSEQPRMYNALGKSRKRMPNFGSCLSDGSIPVVYASQNNQTFDCSFDTRIDAYKSYGFHNKKTVAQLLFEFFEFFARKFDYRTMEVNAKNGCVQERPSLAGEKKAAERALNTAGAAAAVAANSAGSGNSCSYDSKRRLWLSAAEQAYYKDLDEHGGLPSGAVPMPGIALATSSSVSANTATSATTTVNGTITTMSTTTTTSRSGYYDRFGTEPFFCVMDPFVANRNVAGTCRGERFIKVWRCFDHAYKCLARGKFARAFEPLDSNK